LVKKVVRTEKGFGLNEKNSVDSQVSSFKFFLCTVHFLNPKFESNLLAIKGVRQRKKANGILKVWGIDPVAYILLLGTVTVGCK
jgi:hypothetical protein